MNTLNYTLTRNQEHGLEIRYTFKEGLPAMKYLNNGDPGYPAEGYEVLIDEILLHGKDIQDILTDEEYYKIEDFIFENHDRS